MYPRIAVSGVISSCETSASSCRRAASAVSSARVRCASSPAIWLNDRASAVTSSPPCSGARASRSPAPRRSVAACTAFSRRRAGPKITSAISVVPTIEHARGDQCDRRTQHAGRSCENGGPPGSTTTRPTGMPSTRIGDELAASWPRQSPQAAWGCTSRGDRPVRVLLSDPPRRPNRRGPIDSMNSSSARTASSSRGGTSSWLASI